MPQFRAPDAFRFRLENFAVGITIFVVGLAKKVLIADGLAFFVHYAALAGGNANTE